jgi:outer membrane protein assembly factor BamB
MIFSLLLILQKNSSQAFVAAHLTTVAVDSFWVECNKFSSLPPVFQKGYIMVHRREEPGSIFLLDTKGHVVWSHESTAVGFKVVRYTKAHTFLCITGTKENEIGYGNAILELSLKGDTVFYLKKGEHDFQQSIHHEILLNSKNQLITLTREQKIVDLSSSGGSKKDTVFGDGILVLDRKGKRLWKWSVFDILNPLLDKNILTTKKDWTHANSIAFDRDGNYLVSFYNNGQVWKINSVTGRVMWKLGKGGNFEIPIYAVFDQAHAAHINSKGWLMLFDNGGNKKISRSLAFEIDAASKKALPVVNAWLPPPLYTNRMGSSYLINDTSMLVCISRHKMVALTNLQGGFLWKLNANRIQSYRAEFIPKEMLQPYLPKLVHTISNN